ncbi:MAG: hypothetical protein RR806_01545 [Oscillospiraceae bacterium]
MGFGATAPTSKSDKKPVERFFCFFGSVLTLPMLAILPHISFSIIILYLFGIFNYNHFST